MLQSNKTYELSSLRLWVMRVPYFLTGVLFTFTAWTSLINYWGEFEAMEGVAYAFWGALSVLALFGLRFPIKMLPLLLLQFGYKLLWIVAVGYPLMSNEKLDAGGQELFNANLIGAFIDVIAIPWFFVFKTYFVRAFTGFPER